ncbi:MAG: hypothetical protein V4480_00185 [Patescibacteria group bacterium]
MDERTPRIHSSAADSGYDKQETAGAVSERSANQLRHAHEQLAQKLAREFLDAGNPAQALALLRNSSRTTTTNLTMLIGIWAADPENSGDEAQQLFASYAGRADSFNLLMDTLRYIRSPKRGPLPASFAGITESRMRELNPEWDGTPDTRHQEHDAERIRLSNSPPEQISDPTLCLELAFVASATTAAAAFLNRYVELGGSPDDEKYLRTVLNLIQRGRWPVKDAAELIEKLAQRIPPESFRRWARKHSIDSPKDGYFQVPSAFSRLVLANYIQVDPSHLDEADWLYISTRSLEIGERALMEACFEHLKGIVRTEESQRVFEDLFRKVSKTPEDGMSEADRQLGNKIYNQLSTRTAVNRDAAIVAWAHEVIRN